MNRLAVATEKAPAAIGTYSQAVACGDTVYLSGQIPLVPGAMTLVEGDVAAEVGQVLDNLAAVAEAAGGSLDQMVKLTVYLTDLGDFGTVNEVMSARFSEPYPARAAIEVAGLPKGARVEIDGIMVR
jgi:reactive intermediate/imine deaminase